MPINIMAIMAEKVIAVVRASSAATSRKEMLKMIKTFAVSRIWTFAKKYANRDPTARPTAMPSRMDTGMLTKLSIEALSPCIMPTKVENSTMTYTSSTDAPARISCGMPCFTP